MGVAERLVQPGEFDVDAFAAFIESRPENEKWQLVDGVATRLMTPASIVHQRIAMNFAMLLNAAFKKHRAGLFAYCEIGLRLPDRQDFQPEPDVVVLPRETPDGYWTDDCRLVAEVLSPSNDREMIDRKVQLYSTAPRNLHILIIAQDAVKVVHRARSQNWRPVELGEEHRLELPEFGLDIPVVDLYEDTRLDPRPS